MPKPSDSNDSAQAVISWIPGERGGRQHPPAGPIYSTVARFEDDENWPRRAWSIVVEFERELSGGQHIVAKVRFLAGEAPVELLQEGSRFELLEGRRRTAKGVIVPQRTEIPAELNAFEAALIG
jgi:hypothetical protein